MLIGLTGYAGVGKDTVANYIAENYGFTRIGFADKLKELARMIDPDLDALLNVVDWEIAKKVPKYRRFLQDLGNSARLVLGDQVWINQVINSNIENVVISDVRYANEFDAISQNGGILIRIIRQGVGPLNAHITETGHDQLPVDYTIDNGLFLGELYDVVEAVMSEIRLKQ